MLSEQLKVLLHNPFIPALSQFWADIRYQATTAINSHDNSL
jgi:hypothetical protein